MTFVMFEGDKKSENTKSCWLQIIIFISGAAETAQ